jgi:hypothetical protein
LNLVERNYPNGWVRTGNIFSFPHDWQVPAKTELWAYEKLIKRPQPDLFTQYICFPWASLVDYLDHQPSKANLLLSALKQSPPKMAVKVITYCQHIYALKLLPYFKVLGVTDIYWSHKIKGQNQIDGITLHPYPLYPVMHYKRKNPYKSKPLKERKYLYSFIGAYQADLYLTPVRKWIFDLPARNDTIIIERSEWHFEQDVYQNQLLGVTESQAQESMRKQYEDEYIAVMEDSVFCLCPSGSGPNSIRIWEALAFGCIPVILSDSLDVEIDSKSIVQISENESSIWNLPKLLEEKSAIFNKNKE